MSHSVADAFKQQLNAMGIGQHLVNKYHAFQRVKAWNRLQEAAIAAA